MSNEIELKKTLRKSVDNLLSSLNTWLHMKALVEDVDGIKDFVKYVNRYTASELQFMLEEHGMKPEIEKLVDRIEENLCSEQKVIDK